MAGEAGKRQAEQQQCTAKDAATSSSEAAHKRQRAGPLSGLCVYLHGSIPSLHRRLPVIQKRLATLGAATSSSPAPLAASVTHVVLHTAADGTGGGTAGRSHSSGGGTSSGIVTTGPQAAPPTAAGSLQQLLQDLKKLLQRQQQLQQSTAGAAATQLQLVSDAWLDAVLTTGKPVPEHHYSLQHLLDPSEAAGSGGSSRRSSHNSSSSSDRNGAGSSGPGSSGEAERSLLTTRRLPELLPAPDAPLGKYAAWLGHWCSDFNSIKSSFELVLQASFSAEAAARRGSNEAVRAALKELTNYEEALGGAKGMSDEAAGSASSGINHQALTYAHAAAVVRGCAFPLSAAMAPAELEQLLPLVGKFTANIIHQLLATGTCEQLEQFRLNLPVKDSRGQLRPGTAGAMARSQFVKLPGVGPAMAKKWWQQGFTSIAQVLAAVEAAAAAGLGLTSAALYSLRFHKDLLEPVSLEDSLEMQETVMSALVTVTGVTDGWKMEMSGGGRRTEARHDADYLISHPQLDLEGLAGKVCIHLVGLGRLVPAGEGFCLLKQGHMPGLKERLRRDIQTGVHDGNNLDKYDHVFGIYITAVAHKRRRLDLIFVLPDQWPFAVMGWTGSKQYLRFVRQYAAGRSMFQGSHFLFREVAALSSPATLPVGAGAGSGSGDASAAAGTGSGGVPTSTTRLVLSVPDEVAPADRNGMDWWPPGWEPAAAAGVAAGPAGAAGGSGIGGAAAAAAGGGGGGGAAAAGCRRRRVIESEEQIFEFLGLPYRTPAERDC